MWKLTILRSDSWLSNRTVKTYPEEYEGALLEDVMYYISHNKNIVSIKLTNCKYILEDEENA